jgi:hypothetical protein
MIAFEHATSILHHNDFDGTCSTHEKDSKCKMYFMGKSEANRPLERSRSVLEYNSGYFNINLSEQSKSSLLIYGYIPGGNPLTWMMHTSGVSTNNKQNKPCGHGSRPNYSDRVTAACQRSKCQIFLNEGAAWSAQRIPTVVYSIF